MAQRRWAVALAGLLVLGGLASGQSAKPALKGPPPTAPKFEPAAKTDPTKPSPELQKVLEVPRVGPNAAAPKMPTLTLKGRVIAKDKPPAALIEVEPKQPPVLVTKGSTLILGGNVRLQVLDVSAEEVRIEIRPLNETIVLR